MTDKDIEQSYRDMFDKIHASDELKERVLNNKRRRRHVKPIAAMACTAAAAVAAVMIILPVQNRVERDTADNGVISETRATESATAPAAENPSAGDEDADNAAAPNAAEQSRRNTPAKSDSSAGGAKTRNTVTPAPAATAPAKNSITKTAPENPAPAKSGSSAGSAKKNNAAANTPYNTEQSGAPRNAAAKTPALDSAAESVSDVPAAYSEGDDIMGARLEPEDNYSMNIAAHTGGSVMRSAPQPTPEYESGQMVAMSLNDTAIMSAVMSASADTESLEYVTSDITERVKLSEDMEYKGCTKMARTTDENGNPVDEMRLYNYSGDNDRYANILCSPDTTYVDSMLASPDVNNTKVEDIPVDDTKPDSVYFFYMNVDDAAYVVNTHKLTKQENVDLLTSLGAESR